MIYLLLEWRGGAPVASASAGTFRWRSEWKGQSNTTQRSRTTGAFLGWVRKRAQDNSIERKRKISVCWWTEKVTRIEKPRHSYRTMRFKLRSFWPSSSFRRRYDSKTISVLFCFPDRTGKQESSINALSFRAKSGSRTFFQVFYQLQSEEEQAFLTWIRI